MDVVDRAIQWVDIPDMIEAASLLTTLLGHNTIGGVILADMTEQELLRDAIGLGHQVDEAFIIDMQVLAKIGAEDFAGLFGEGNEIGESGRHSGHILAGLGEKGKEKPENTPKTPREPRAPRARRHLRGIPPKERGVNTGN